MSGYRRVLATWGVWLVFGALATVLAVRRFNDAAFDSQPDLGGFFLPAARAIASGESPFTVAGYFYTPLVALLLLPVADAPAPEQYWTALRLAAGVIACAVTALACTPRGAWLRAGIVACGAVVTLWWSWPTTLDLWAGQVQLLVLLALGLSAFAETRGRRFLAGFALGMGAVIKTWPALFALWLARSGVRRRGREWLGLLAAAAVAVIITLATAGPSGVAAMIIGPFGGGDQPLLAANSVWGLPRIMFSETPMAEPLLDSPLLRYSLTAVLLICVIALGVLALVRPGPPVISLYNIAFLVILILPVSHYFYVLYALPTLWWWGARLLERPRAIRVWLVFAVLLVWWFVVFRVSPEGDGFMTTTWPSLLRIFGASLVAVTMSVLGAAALYRESWLASRESITSSS